MRNSQNLNEDFYCFFSVKFLGKYDGLMAIIKVAMVNARFDSHCRLTACPGAPDGPGGP